MKRARILKEYTHIFDQLQTRETRQPTGFRKPAREATGTDWGKKIRMKHRETVGRDLQGLMVMSDASLRSHAPSCPMSGQCLEHHPF